MVAGSWMPVFPGFEVGFAVVVWWRFGVSWLFCDLFWCFWLCGLVLVEIWCFLVCVIECGCRSIVSAWRLVDWLVLGWFCCLGLCGLWLLVAMRVSWCGFD